MNPTNTIDKLTEILELYAQNIATGGLSTMYPDMLNAKEAEQAIIAWALEAVGEDEQIIYGSDKDLQYDPTVRNQLRAEIRRKLEIM